MKFNTRDLHKMLLGICEFCKIWPRKADIFVLSHNVITVVCVCSETVRHSGRKERHGEACVRHTVRHL